MIYSPGDIVLAKYTNMDGESGKALFLVVYNEALDSSVDANGNLLVAKVTTNYSFFDTYSYALSTHRYSFLHKVCYVRVNKVNTLVTTDVLNYLGKLSNKDRSIILEKFHSFEVEVQRQNQINNKFNYKGEN